jgi:putative nucleotidyltransferase with HDIG domain
MLTDTQEVFLKKEKTQKVLANVINLPVIPKVMFDATRLLDNPYTSATELNKTISKDQALLTKILTIANSPLYGLQRKVTTIEYAILVLGYRELKNIISALSVAEAFRNKADKYLNTKDIMLHSYMTGTACKKLASDMGFKNSGEAFIAGYLHDIGISVIHRYLHSSFINIFEMVENDQADYNAAEMEVLGMTHEEVGHYLLEKWNFPKEISEPVLYHHHPNETNFNSTLGTIINLADYITYRLKLGNATWDKDIKLSNYTMKSFNIDNELGAEKCVEQYKSLFWEQLEFVKFLF